MLALLSVFSFKCFTFNSIISVFLRSRHEFGNLRSLLNVSTFNFQLERKSNIDCTENADKWHSVLLRLFATQQRKLYFLLVRKVSQDRKHFVHWFSLIHETRQKFQKYKNKIFWHIFKHNDLFFQLLLFTLVGIQIQKLAKKVSLNFFCLLFSIKLNFAKFSKQLFRRVHCPKLTIKPVRFSRFFS